MFWINLTSSTQQNKNCTAIYLPFHKSCQCCKQDMLGTAREIRTNSWATFFSEILHMDTSSVGRPFISSVMTLDTVLETYRGHITRDAERGWKKSVLSAQLADYNLGLTFYTKSKNVQINKSLKCYLFKFIFSLRNQRPYYRETLEIFSFKLQNEKDELFFLQNNYILLNRFIPVRDVNVPTIVEGDEKALFSIATTPKCRRGRHSFPWIAPLYLRYVPYIAEC